MRIFSSIHPKSECIFFVSVQFNISTILPFEPLSSIPGRWETDICPCGLFCTKFYAKKLLFEAFFGIMRIFGSVQPKSECNFLFIYNLIFQLYHLSSPVAPLWGGIDICPRGLFCLKFDAEKLLFEAFFRIKFNTWKSKVFCCNDKLITQLAGKWWLSVPV